MHGHLLSHYNGECMHLTSSCRTSIAENWRIYSIERIASTKVFSGRSNISRRVQWTVPPDSRYKRRKGQSLFAKQLRRNHPDGPA